MPASIARTSRSASAALNPKPLRTTGLASHCIPKLGDILVPVVKDCALAGESSERRVYDLVLRIGASGHAQQDVGIYQTRRNRHLVVILVKPIAGNSLGQRWNLVRELRQ
jgi:hypothetical protein